MPVNTASERLNLHMNYLAHAWLSFGLPEILVGNMISDYVKGKKKFDYPEEVQKGIALHRAIDRYTDTHAATAIAKQYFKAEYGLYSAAFVDVVFDHFLANDPNEFTDESLMKFSQETYRLLEPYAAIFPEKFARMYPYMRTQNWLYHYRFEQGIASSLGGLVRRAAYLNDSAPAFNIFKENYGQLDDCYKAFFPQLKKMALEELNTLK